MWLLSRFLLIWTVGLTPGVSSLLAADVAALAKRIDQRIGQQHAAASVTPQPPVSDHQFIRRVTLDLAGRVPTIAELDAFVESTDQRKRALLVAQLIDSSDFAFHRRNEIDLTLLRRLEHNDSWREYLLEATKENRSWEQMFREIMLPEDHCPDDPRPVTFLKRRIGNIDSVTNDSSILWFGVNVGCAKCHDHPLVYDWTQAHYYGMASFFKRTFQTKKGMLGERFDGQLKYTTTDGDEFQADYMFLTGAKVAEPDSKLEEGKLKEIREAIKKSEKSDQAEAPPRPDFRPRTELVDLALADDQQRFFAKNLVNRVWARLLGRGLVHPLDQMHSENPPSHPELLDELSQDVVQHGYDVRRLVHAIVLSDTYAQRMGEESVAPELFASALPRPLTPHQLSLSYLVATSHPGELSGGLEGEAWSQTRAELERRSEGQARRFSIPQDGFQVSVDEALWFSNNSSVQNDLLAGNRNKLVGYLKEFDSSDEVSYRACKAVLSRPPDSQQHALITDYIDSRADRREDAIGQVVWALLSSSEFRFNH